MARHPEAVLAIDLGTSSAKALVVTPDGQALGKGQASYPTLHPRDRHDEQLVDDWLQAIVSAAASARRFAPNATISAIAVTGQMHGTVLLDRHGLPLHPAVIWSDRRTAEMVEPFRTRLGASGPRIIGGPLGTGYMALSLAWFREHRPHLWDEIARVALPADLVGLILGGTLATDPSNAVSTGLLNAESGQWDASMLAAFEVPDAWLPRLVPSGSQVGELTSEAAVSLDLPAGIPIIHGGGDAPAAAVGGSVLDESMAMVTLSTGAQVTRPVTTYEPEPEGRWHTWPSALPHGVGGAGWLSVGAMLNAGRAIDWIHRLLSPGMPVADLLALAATAPAGSDGLLFLPYLAGERSPLLDPYASGAFIGLTELHGPQHLVRAVIEGIGLSLADTLERMTPDSAGAERIVFGGGGSSPELRQIIASVMGAPLMMPPVQETSALGAARLAAAHLGWDAFDAPDTAWEASSTTVKPLPGLRELYRERLACYREAAEATLATMHHLRQPGP